MKSIRFAYVVNDAGRFEVQHFGNADKFLIYEWIDNEFIFIREEFNSFKNFDIEQVSGSYTKGAAIIELLKSGDVKVLVSRQFGINIQMVNKLFIPVIVSSETTDEVVSILKKHIRWIEDELNNKPEGYKLFTIKNGILKTTIGNEN